MSLQPSVTVIIINYNGLDDTINCLNTVLKTDYSNFSIYLLDNGSKSNQIPDLQQKFSDKRITWERSELNLGFTGGNNKGITQSISDYVVLLNNDTEVEEKWLKELVEVAESDPKIGACQAKLRSLNLPEYFEYAGAAGGKIDSLGYPYARGRIGFHLEKDQGQYDQSVQIEWASGAAMLLRKSAINEVGTLSEDFFLYQEEIDLCWRIRNFGYKVVFAPKSVIYHKGLASTKSDISNSKLIKKTFYVHRNNLLMIARNMSFKRLLIILPVRIALDYVSLFFYLLNGKIEYMRAVIQAQISFIKMIPEIIKFRKVQATISYQAEKSFSPISIYWSYFILGKKHFSELQSDEKSNIPLMYYDDIIQKNFIIKNRKKGLRLISSPYVFIPLLSAVLIISWYSSGKLIASGEEGLAFANPLRTFNLYKYLWYDTGTGYPMPLMIPRTTYYALASLFDYFFVYWVAQALTLYVTIVAGMTGMYFFSKMILKSKIASVIAALFYFFNLFTMTQIFGRQITNGYVLWAYLPIFLGSWIKIIETKKISWILVLITSSFIFSNSFGHPAYVITIWIPVMLYILYYTAINFRNKLELVSLSKIVALALSTWTITNLWWLYPFVSLGQSVFTSTDSSQASFDSLRGVSQFFPIPEIIQLKQSALFASIFNGYYNSTQAITITYAIAAIVAIGVLVGIKSKVYRYIILLLIVAIFLSKGSNQPFGHKFYSFIFNYVPATQALRNPYEKIGLLVVLSYAVLFAVGLFAMLNRIKRVELRVLIGGATLFTVLGLLVFPTWKGSLYGAEVQNTRVLIPDYYKQANEFINNQKTDGRILMLPIFYGDAVNYNWEKGNYNGIDPSEFLFDRPVISKILRMKYYDDKYLELYNNIQSRSYQSVLANFNEMNIKYLVLRNDYSITESTPSAVVKLNQDITTLPQIHKLQTYGHLEIFEHKDLASYQHFTVEGQNPPEISYYKINPTKYQVQVKNSQSPYSLIFRETFNEKWKAKSDNQLMNNHYIKYNYANAWEIDKPGTYQIEVDFSI